MMLWITCWFPFCMFRVTFCRLGNWFYQRSIQQLQWKSGSPLLWKHRMMGTNDTWQRKIQEEWRNRSRRWGNRSWESEHPSGEAAGQPWAIISFYVLLYLHPAYSKLRTWQNTSSCAAGIGCIGLPTQKWTKNTKEIKRRFRPRQHKWICPINVLKCITRYMERETHLF